jgi:hypothetical protein
MSEWNPFTGIFPLPLPKPAVRRAETTERYRYVRRDHSQCAARVADLRTTLGDGHLEPLDIVAAYYIADHTCDSYVFSIQELESVRLAMLLGRPKPDFRQSLVRRIDTILQELISSAFEPCGECRKPSDGTISPTSPQMIDDCAGRQC